ncbi:uroporphyrinogen-III C-methyltransferase [Aulographum hederae CBS 113979]|uniref:Uroporphyrinogen-III C-methyltransferase n=1 Tax=Aulographum hederae CBS 113979 TaxID=1176131 RepID=A0A6G1GS41_9PEZI|nr:uroporphyrinogen-III C-methyltransferase [Aulographum hederae CBS 113979]
MLPALLTAVDSTSHVHLIIGSNPLAGARCAKSLEIGATPKLIAPADAALHYGLQKRVDSKEVEWIQRDFQDEDVKTLGREDVAYVVDAVFVTLGGKHSMSKRISDLCRRLRIPVNVTDAPALSTFTLLSTHTDGPLQIGITTSGQGCKLSSRIRREIASSLPPNLGAAVTRLGAMRRRIWEQDHIALNATTEIEAEEDDDISQPATFNKLVLPADVEAARTRRMRWLGQICEYWPLKRLATITDADVNTVLQAYTSSLVSASSSPDSHHQQQAPLSPLTLDARARPRGTIILAGSGPGHPSLLTLATHRAILTADLILADKLVPSAVLDLIPRRTPVHIARKFPGNADAAQAELISLALAGLREGKTVVRLKQGDPYLYGRGAEEYEAFRKEGWEVAVLPGITSALSAPLFAGVPATHRGVAEEVLVCTGTGRKGVSPRPPGYGDRRTVVFLMALHRLEGLVRSLVGSPKSDDNAKVGEEEAGTPEVIFADPPYPPSTPVTIIERASCPDQRVIRSTLEWVAQAVEEEGSRPPGLLVVGKACEVLERFDRGGGRRWKVEEGFTLMGGFACLDLAGENDMM